MKENFNKNYSLKRSFVLFSFIFVLWAFYRYLPKFLPVWVEELILKPIVWILPTLWVVRKIEKESFSSLGYTSKKFFSSLKWGIGLGVILALEGILANILKYSSLNFGSFQMGPKEFLFNIFISLATAVSEETVFRGYFFNRFWKSWKNELVANLISSFLFTVIHLPIVVFEFNYAPPAMSTYLFLVFIYGVSSAFVFARTNNIVSSIMLHLMWSWPIILFK